MPWISPKDRPKITVGIDPDVDKSGVVIRYDLQGKSFEPVLLNFFALYDKLKSLRDTYGKETIKVRIDAGWLNKKTNFRQKIKVKGQWANAPEGVKEKMSMNTGRNHETGMKIEEMCNYLQISCELVQPKDKKWTPQYLKAATGIETKNQEIIDAGRLVA